VVPLPPGSTPEAPALRWTQHPQREMKMPVILWLLGVPLGLILLFMLIF
jgi:hypothetical protein